MTGYGIKALVPGVWEIDDGVNGSLYIIEGTRRALVIDTGMAQADVIEMISSVTSKPFSLALTHGHGDHSMHCSRFDRVYLDFADREMLFSQRFPGQLVPDERNLVNISAGDRLDLGGAVIKTVPLPGHTPGSMLFVDETHKCVFTGDAVGSGCGVWMQVPGALPLSEYAASIRRAANALKDMGVADSDWTFCGGHASQRYLSTVSTDNPVCLALMYDMALLCDKLVSGEIAGSKEGVDERAARFGDVYFAKYGTAEMLFQKEQLF